MSTLQETVQQRRKEAGLPARSAESSKAPVRTLQIHSWNGEKWVFPWAHFSAAHHDGAGESEQLVLSFANREVVLSGSHLELLLPEIANFHLDCLRDMPAKFHVQADPDEPFISRVSVRAASASSENSAQTS